MKTLALLALVLGGCTEAGILDAQSSPIAAEWAVTVDGNVAPSCNGKMALTIGDGPIRSVSGSWSCTGDFSVGGQITNGHIVPNGSIFFDMQITDQSSSFAGVMDGLKFSGHAGVLGAFMPIVATPMSLH